MVGTLLAGTSGSAVLVLEASPMVTATRTRMVPVESANTFDDVSHGLSGLR
jgi:hypothetical protein